MEKVFEILFIKNEHSHSPFGVVATTSNWIVFGTILMVINFDTRNDTRKLIIHFELRATTSIWIVFGTILMVINFDTRNDTRRGLGTGSNVHNWEKKIAPPPTSSTTQLDKMLKTPPYEHCECECTVLVLPKGQTDNQNNNNNNNKKSL